MKLQLLEHIEQFHVQQNLMLASDRDIFSVPIKTWDSHNAYQIKQFIFQIRLVVKQNIIDTNKHGRNFCKITTYFKGIKIRKKAQTHVQKRQQPKIKYKRSKYSTTSSRKATQGVTHL